MTLRDYLQNAGYKLVDKDYGDIIKAWGSWYRGNVEDFHRYHIYNGNRAIPCKRASLNMAKQGCEYWANLLWNRACHVNIDKSEIDEYVNSVLFENDFYRCTNRLTEQAFAFGTGAYVAYEANAKTVIEYLTAEYIFPLAWHGDDITSCAFAASRREGKRKYTDLMIHEEQENGTYKVYNRRFMQKGDTDAMEETSLPPGILEEYAAGVRRYAIVKPNIANNLADVPLGISIYANCIDTLKSIDLAYDGAKVAMEIGRPRIGVSGNMLKPDSVSGGLRPLFDATDIAVYDMGQSDTDGPPVVSDLTTEYRATSFEQSLQTQLQIYAQQIGLGEKTFQWDGSARSSITTATQVISENMAMLRTMEKHQEGMRTSITQIVRAVLDIGGRDISADISIVFDDSIVRNREAEAREAWQWVVIGYYPFWKYLVEYQGYDESEAKQLEAEGRGASMVEL